MTMLAAVPLALLATWGSLRGISSATEALADFSLSPHGN